MIVFQVACYAGLGSSLQVIEGMRVHVTRRTFHRRMFADQVERHLIMVEGRAVRIDAIVTGHAVRAEGQEVFGGESLVDLQVTVSARGLIEWGGVPVDMAIFAGKRGAVRLLLMSGQFE